MIEIKKSNEIEKGNQVDFIGVVAALREGTTATKKPFISITMEDSLGQVDVKIWDNSLKDLLTDLKVGDFIKIRAEVKEWNGVNQLDVELKDGKPLLRKVDPEKDNVKIEDYIRTAPIEAEKMFMELYETASSFKNETIKYITMTLLEENKEKLYFWPGSMIVHHAHHAGLAMHTHSMLQLAKPMIDAYPSLDADLLQAGVILHDIGKLEELEANNIGKTSDYTLEGSLLGHAVLGIEMISRVVNAAKSELNSETILCLKHMIASHHYEEAWGAAVRPSFLEAELLHHLDLMDSKLQQMADVTEAMADGARSERIKYLGNRRLFKKNA